MRLSEKVKVSRLVSAASGSGISCFYVSSLGFGVSSLDVSDLGSRCLGSGV